MSNYIRNKFCDSKLVAVIIFFPYANSNAAFDGNFSATFVDQNSQNSFRLVFVCSFIVSVLLLISENFFLVFQVGVTIKKPLLVIFL